MKTKDALEIIDEGWVKKKKGFRVHFQKMVNAELITDYVPPQEVKPLDSDVVAWRLAWKLAEATKTYTSEINDGEIINVYVVDDEGHPMNYYATNRPEIFNAKDVEKG
ncbi:MAG: hypothetical protein JSW56_02065 [Deltaproteobacteria bacterium]|nr:MAG: hypothetical protein JSW56_02065 [Deltaproteobacteria bacterium]